MSDRGRYADTWKQKIFRVLTRIIHIQVHTVQPGNLRGEGGCEGQQPALHDAAEEAIGYVNERRQGEHDVMTDWVG